MEVLKTQSEFPFKLGKFSSKVRVVAPDAQAYLDQKGVNFINVTTDQLPEVEISTPLNDLHSPSWKMIHAPLINLAVSGTKSENYYPRTFPGPIVSGPKLTEQYVGSTSWELFQHMLTIPQRVIDVDKLRFNKDIGYTYEGEKPVIELSDIALPDKWFWNVAVPNLKQLQLGTSTTDIDATTVNLRANKIVKKLQQTTDVFWDNFSINGDDTQQRRVKMMLSLIQIVQTPFVKNDISEDAVETANSILVHYKKMDQKENILPLLFQIESSVMYAQAMSEREVIARGLYGHSWVEVAKTKVEDLRSTELVDEKRAIVEIVNLINRGWAPIVVDEKMNNTDGSHRGIAVRVWNLLKDMTNAGIKDLTDISDPDMQEVVKTYIATNKDMKGLTLRETLRVAEELLTNPLYCNHRKEIFGAIPLNPNIKFIPTVLLREQEACCVVKVPFDQKGEIIGVNPFITHTLTDGRNDLALGSRGPYHRTDKTPLPWFDVFSLQTI